MLGAAKRAIDAQAGRRRIRRRAPAVTDTSGDATQLRYHIISATVTSDAAGNRVLRRNYIVGSNGNGDVLPAPGTAVASYYSTGKFLPGTVAKWCPSVSFNTSGRVFAGFTDNAEVAAQINTLYNTYATTPTTINYTNYADAVKALGNVTSFPIWQETVLQVPTRLRRRMFDINTAADLQNADVLDRCMQTVLFFAFEGVNTNTVCGITEYHDVMYVEGLHNRAT